MNPLNLRGAKTYIEENIGPSFHKKKIDKLQDVTLKSILDRKNPYLFKAKGCESAHELISSVLDATVSSGEETIFGNFLENIAIFICEQVHGGRKSSTKGIDLEFEDGKRKYLISIKSGPHWGNSGQKEAMIHKFNLAKRTLATSGGAKDLEIVCIEGCCYGTENIPDKGTHQRLCGQSFWELLSGGSETLYKDIIEPLGDKAKTRDDELRMIYDKKLNLLTKEFLDKFCDNSGVINWDKLIEYNSGKRKPKAQ
jgi:hypothetical protein